MSQIYQQFKLECSNVKAKKSKTIKSKKKNHMIKKRNIVLVWVSGTGGGMGKTLGGLDQGKERILKKHKTSA